MRLDDETTAHQLHRLLVEKGYSISLRTILRCRTALGRTFRGSAYCQLIREANKTKRLAWAQQHLHSSFDMVGMNAQCKWRVIAVLHVENVVRHHVPSQGEM